MRRLALVLTLFLASVSGARAVDAQPAGHVPRVGFVYFGSGQTGLGAERYAAGCPVHRASLAPGHVFSSRLGGLVQSAFTTLSAEFPHADLVRLDVQRAFDGARLCEKTGSPADTLATPMRLQDGATGTFVTSLSGLDKLDIQLIANTCVTY